MKDETVMVHRGEIYYADLGDPYGSEQGGIRPVLVVQNDVGNKYSPTIIVAPMTSKDRKHDLPTHYRLDGLKKPSLILFEQIRAIDRGRLIGSCVHRLSDGEMQQVDAALSISVGLAALKQAKNQ